MVELKTTIGGYVMSGIKGMKMYPQGIREKILAEYKEGYTYGQNVDVYIKKIQYDKKKIKLIPT